MDIGVVGYYNQGNIGDEGFKTSIMRVLGEEHSYTFMNDIPSDVNDAFDRLIIGGGSFLDTRVLGNHDVEIPYAFLGVGVHNVIHPDNVALLEKANLVVTRNRWYSHSPQAGVLRSVEFLHGPDLLFVQMPDFAEVWDGDNGMEERHAAYKKDSDKNVLVILNGFLMPHELSPPETMTAFKEFQSALDSLERHYGSMCFIAMQTRGIDDRWMFSSLDLPEASATGLAQAIWQSDLVLTTRFHGAIYATMMGVPFVAISPHDKFVSYMDDQGWDNIVNYYNFDYKQVIGASTVCPDQQVLHNTAWKNFHWWKISIPYIREKLDI